MRGTVAKGLRSETMRKVAAAQIPISMDTMYWQDPRTQVIRRISTCIRSVYQKAKRNYKGRNK